MTENDDIWAKFGVNEEGYGVAEEGPLKLDSPIHGAYLVQTFPDPLVTGDVEKRRRFEELCREWDPLQYPWYDTLRVYQFMMLIDIANKLPSGDCIEVGTFAGESARFIWRCMDQKQSLYCFDTFEGFDSSEVEAENALFEKDISVDFLGGNPTNEVRRYITKGKDGPDLNLVKGRFPESFEGYEHLRFRFAHVDVDLYEPTRATLEAIWPHIVPGGVMLFHDYGCSLFPGVSKAVDEFFEPLGITPMPLCDKLVSAAVIKPKHV